MQTILRTKYGTWACGFNFFQIQLKQIVDPLQNLSPPDEKRFIHHSDCNTSSRHWCVQSCKVRANFYSATTRIIWHALSQKMQSLRILGRTQDIHGLTGEKFKQVTKIIQGVRTKIIASPDRLANSSRRYVRINVFFSFKKKLLCQIIKASCLWKCECKTVNKIGNEPCDHLQHACGACKNDNCIAGNAKS